MPNWNQVLDELDQLRKESSVDAVRRKHLKELADYTGRNVIAYYSGWLTHTVRSPVLNINDEDKNGFMTTVHNLDRDRGLDLILHTPGGDVAAAESLVDYLRKMFGTNIRAFVPQLAMSAGTMIACSCQCIFMGKESNLGPIDPQMNGFPANGVIAEFEQALREVEDNPAAIPIWQAIIGKYHPTFLGSCQQAITWAERIVKEWLVTGMLDGKGEAEEKAAMIIDGLSDREKTYNHARHIHVEQLLDMGLDIRCLEDDDTLQDLVLTVHHLYMHTFAGSRAQKIIENHDGLAFVRLGGTEQG